MLGDHTADPAETAAGEEPTQRRDHQQTQNSEADPGSSASDRGARVEAREQQDQQ